MRVKKFVRRISSGVIENCIACNSASLPVMEDPDQELVDTVPGFGVGDVWDGSQYVKTPEPPVDFLSDRYQKHWLEALTDMAWDFERRLRQLGSQSNIGPLRAPATKQEYRDAVGNHVKNLLEKG